MSAILILVLRILMIVSLYIFLGLSLFVMWKNINHAAKEKSISELPTLKISVQGDAKKSISFSQLEIFLGRDPQNDYQIKDEGASGSHARIYFKNSQWLVEDLQSTNGTFLNGERILASTIILPNDIIRIGSQQFSVYF